MGVYTFSFLTVGKRQEYSTICGRCESTIYFILQESSQKGELDCPFCARALKIWETYDCKDRIVGPLSAEKSTQGSQGSGEEEVSGQQETPE